MKPFTKSESISLAIIFLVLVLVSWPNFAVSLRRARDQIRRDDIGNIQGAIDAYYSDYGIYPASSPDGKIIGCRDENADPAADESGIIYVEQRPCNWGKDTWISLTSGVNKTYLKVIPGDPETSKGASYVYFSDGSRYQLLGALESEDEPGYDQKLVDRNVVCGNRVCNIGRANNVPLYISIEEYNLQIYCGQHPKDIKCLYK